MQDADMNLAKSMYDIYEAHLNLRGFVVSKWGALSQDERNAWSIATTTMRASMQEHFQKLMEKKLAELTNA